MTLQKEIVLSGHHIDALKKHAKEGEPNESCAILFGKSDSSRFQVIDIFFTKNVESSPVIFTISNEELIDAYQEAERKNLQIIGIFHSHPDSAPYPSPTDRKYMEINPIPWLIFSNSSDELRAYILESGISPMTISLQ